MWYPAFCANCLIWVWTNAFVMAVGVHSITITGDWIIQATLRVAGRVHDLPSPPPRSSPAFEYGWQAMPASTIALWHPRRNACFTHSMFWISKQQKFLPPFAVNNDSNLPLCSKPAIDSNPAALAPVDMKPAPAHSSMHFPRLPKLNRTCGKTVVLSSIKNCLTPSSDSTSTPTNVQVWAPVSGSPRTLINSPVPTIRMIWWSPQSKTTDSATKSTRFPFEKLSQMWKSMANPQAVS